jgi:hypothetical protein
MTTSVEWQSTSSARLTSHAITTALVGAENTLGHLDRGRSWSVDPKVAERLRSR